MKSKAIVGAVVLVLAASAASAAKAKHDLNVLADTKLSLTDAIGIAERGQWQRSRRGARGG